MTRGRKKKTNRKKVADKRGPHLLEQDPPIIVGGGSVFISIRRDLGLRAAGTSGNYKVFEVRNVDALVLDVFQDANSTGSEFVLDSQTHESVYWDTLSLPHRSSFKRTGKS